MSEADGRVATALVPSHLSYNRNISFVNRWMGLQPGKGGGGGGVGVSWAYNQDFNFQLVINLHVTCF